MKNLAKALFLSSKGFKFNQASKQAMQVMCQQRYSQNIFATSSLHFNNKFRFSTNFGEGDLKNLSSILSQHSSRQDSAGLLQVQQKVNAIKINLTKIDVTLLQEFHKRLVEYYTQQRDLQTDATERKKCNALILEEHTQLYLVFEGLDFQDEVIPLCDKLVNIYEEVKNDLIFQSSQFEFDYLITLSQIFNSHKKDDQSFDVFKRLQVQTPQNLKQQNYEKYIESQCERVTLSQVTRNHDQVFDHLDILFSECDKITIPKENTKLLSKINEYFLRGILLSTQFDNKTEQQNSYQLEQKKFIQKYNYQPSTIEKLTLQVKEISEKTPNYIQVKGEQVNLFVENHKLEFSKNVQDILIYQLYNQVVPLNLFEYFYMLVKFEANYREEVEEVPVILRENPEDLVEDFEEVIISNIQTLLEIRKLIVLFTKEVIEIDITNPYSQLEVSGWISHIKPHYQVKIKDVFKNLNETYI